MINIRQWVSYRVHQIYNSLLSGGMTSFAGMLFIGLCVLIFLFATVHNRDIKEIPQKSATRNQNTIMVWIKAGYFEHWGLPFQESVSDNPTQKVWRSNPMGYLQAAHLIERLNYLVRGQYSYRLMALHNQAIVWISSALLGLLAMRLLCAMKVNPLHALLLGIATQCVYQTFPANLFYYWEIYPNAVMSLWVIVFLVIEQKGIEGEKIPKWCLPLRALCVFALVYSEPFSASLFLAAYLSVCLILSYDTNRRFGAFKTLIFPAIAAAAIYWLQLLWVSVCYPGVELYGSGFMFRTGFDGATTYYVRHTDLILSRISYVVPQSAAHLQFLSKWWFLIAGGVLSFVSICLLYVVSQPPLKNAVYVLIIALGLYVPFSFLFSQATIVHPYGYDIYLAIPLVLALFAVLPASLERLMNSKGIFVLASVMTAFCYCMVQIRTYSIAYPIIRTGAGN